MLFKMALTFRIKLDLLSSLFGYSKEEILEHASKSNNKEALDYLFNYDNSNQDIVKSEIIAYYRCLLEAKKSNRVDIYLIALEDYEKEHFRRGNKLSTKDIHVILNYQLKYALTANEILNVFDISKEEYDQNVYEILEENPLLKERFINLAEYFTEKKEEKKNV